MSEIEPIRKEIENLKSELRKDIESLKRALFRDRKDFDELTAEKERISVILRDVSNQFKAGSIPKAIYEIKSQEALERISDIDARIDKLTKIEPLASKVEEHDASIKEVKELKKIFEEKISRVEKKTVDELLGEKEDIFAQLEELKKKLDAKAITKENYESALREKIERLAEVDEKIEEQSKMDVLIGRMEEQSNAIQALGDALKNIAGGEIGAVPIVSDASLEEIRAKIEEYGAELRDNVEQLLQIDARTVEELKELQKVVAGGKIEEIEKEIASLEKLYTDFADESTLSRFASSIREIIKREDLGKIEHALEKGLSEVHIRVEKVEDVLEVHLTKVIESVKTEVEKLREEVIRKQLERLETVERRISYISDDLEARIAQISGEISNLSSLKGQIEQLQTSLDELSSRSKVRSIDELNRERGQVLMTIDTLRGGYEMGAISEAEYKTRAEKSKNRLADIDARIEELRRIETLMEKIAEQEAVLKKLHISDGGDTIGKEEIRTLISELRTGIRTEEIEDIKTNLEWVKASLQNRIEGIPFEMEAKMQIFSSEMKKLAVGVDEKTINEILRRVKDENISDGIRKNIEKEIRASLKEEAKRVLATADKKMADLDEINRRLPRLETGIIEISEKIKELSGANASLRKEIGETRAYFSEAVSRIEKKDASSLLKVKEETLASIDTLKIKFTGNLISKDEYEGELRRKVEEVAEIDVRIEEACKIDTLLMKIGEQEKAMKELAASLAKFHSGEREERTKSEVELFGRATDYFEKMIASVRGATEAKINEQQAAITKIATTAPGIERHLKEVLEGYMALERENIKDIIEKEAATVADEMRKLGKYIATKEEERRREFEKRISRMPAEMDTKVSRLSSEIKELSALKAQLEILQRSVLGRTQRHHRKTLEELMHEKEKILADLAIKGNRGG